LKFQAFQAQALKVQVVTIIRSASRYSNVLWRAARHQGAARRDESAG
jgi:hypothetical protein